MPPITDTLMSHYLRWNFSRHMQLQSSQVLPHPRTGRRYLLYIHIPFCESLCPFCSFHRVKLNRERAQRYFTALRQEIQLYHDLGFDFAYVYVGGGTPTVLPKQLATTLHLVRRLFQVSQISVETSPSHLRSSVLDLLQDAGVNRLSVGVQSLDDVLLKEMERYQPYGSSAEILERLTQTEGRFETFNVDMIFNFPHQSMESLLRDVNLLKGLQPDQISYYPLMPASTTQRAMAQRIGGVEFRRERSMYQEIWDTLLPKYQPGTAWCFSRHTTKAIDEYIVDHGEYVGVGSGSFSYLDGTFYSNSFSINRYLSLIEGGVSGTTASRKLTTREQAQYDFLIRLFGLRMDKARMQHKYGQGYRRLIGKELLFFRLLGALEETGEAYRLTRQGMYYWVLMMREFFIGVNNFRAQMRAHIGQERLTYATLHQTTIECKQPDSDNS